MEVAATAVGRRPRAGMNTSEIGPAHLKVLAVAGLGFFADAYDLFIIGLVVAVLTPLWDLNALQISVLSSLALVASAIGAIIFGRFGDVIGKNRVYGVVVTVLVIGTLVSAASPNYAFLLIMRFLVGLGIGGYYPVSACLMSEYAPNADRGLMVSLVFSAQAVGLVVGPLVGVALLASGMGDEVTWRVMLAIGSVPAIVALLLRRTLPDSSRSATTDQMQRGEARSAAQQQTVAARSLGTGAAIRFVLTHRKVALWVLGASVAWMLLDFAYYGNAVSSPLLLNALVPHDDILTRTIYQLLIFVCAAVPGYIVAAGTMDRLGRKTIQVGGFLMMALSFGAIGLIPGITTTVAPFLVLYGISYFFTEFGPNTTTFVYPSEIFPTVIRTSAYGVAVACGKTGAFIGVFVFPLLLDRFGLRGVELVAAAASLLGLAVTLAWLPESKGKTLEALAAEAGVEER